MPNHNKAEKQADHKKQLKYGTAFIDFSIREKSSPNLFSAYSKFFRGTKWELMAIPPGYNGAYLNKFEIDIKRNHERLLEIPAVYELAVCTFPGKKRYKVYMGKATDMKNRDATYNTSINKLKNHQPLTETEQKDYKESLEVHGSINTSLNSGLFVLRRIRYIAPKVKINEDVLNKSNLFCTLWESRLLSFINYAWNYKDNGQVVGAGKNIDHRRDALLGYRVSCGGCCSFFPYVKFEYKDLKAKKLYKF